MYNLHDHILSLVLHLNRFNLIRISKGEMVGVKYNKDKTWVGGSTGFFEN